MNCGFYRNAIFYVNNWDGGQNFGRSKFRMAKIPNIKINEYSNVAKDEGQNLKKYNVERLTFRNF